MPVRFRPRVGPFVYIPTRRRSVTTQLAVTLFVFAVLVALIVAAVTHVG